jgi:hypothetical protein
MEWPQDADPNIFLSGKVDGKTVLGAVEIAELAKLLNAP